MCLPDLDYMPCRAACYEFTTSECSVYRMVAADLDLRLPMRHHLLPPLLACSALVGLDPLGANAPGLHAQHRPSANRRVICCT